MGFSNLNKGVFVLRKDPHGFFAFPVTDAIAPGYSMIIKHPMDFGTMKEKIAANEYKSVTEFKVNQLCSWSSGRKPRVLPSGGRL